MLSIRKGRKEDIPHVYELILELARYENGMDQVSNTIGKMEEDGFGPNPIYEFIVAENEVKIVGSAVYYFRYSTWKGKRMYLEDLIVSEDQRGQGAGKMLFDEIIAIAKLTKCSGLMWQVLDWNEPAINFYKKYHTNFDGEWVNCSIDF